MQLVDIDNPFVNFLASCGQKHLLSNVPGHAKQSVYGQCRQLDQYWTSQEKVHPNVKAIFVISLDGIGSKELYQLWEKHKYNSKHLIPKYIIDHESPVILFDNSAEGFCDDHIFKFISQVVHHFCLDPDNTFYCNSSYNIQDMQQESGYTNFKTFCSNNFLEDSMAELFDSIQYDYVDNNKLFNIETNLQKQFLFSCLNNAPKYHRALLLGCMIKNDLIQYGYVSSPSVPFEELYKKTISELSIDLEHNIISKDDFKQALEWLDLLQPVYPLEADVRTDDIVHMKQFGDNNFIQNMMNCDIQVITETFSNNNLFVSEKVFKPIVMCQPFIVLGSTHTYRHLENLGYKTFDYLVDTKKLDITRNVIDKISLICDILCKLQEIKQNPVEWNQLNDRISVDLIHNYNHFVERLHKIKTNSTLGVHEFLEIRPGYKLPLTTE